DILAGQPGSAAGVELGGCLGRSCAKLSGVVLAKARTHNHRRVLLRAIVDPARPARGIWGSGAWLSAGPRWRETPPPHRHCKRSKAIQNPSAEKTLDCFAALAMTVRMQVSPPTRIRRMGGAQRYPSVGAARGAR